MYAVLLEDDENHADMRPRHMAAHLAFLEANREAIIAAGPLLDTTTSAPAGGLWLVKADTAADVLVLLQTDPFWPTGLRRSYRILAWKQVFANGARITPGDTAP